MKALSSFIVLLPLLTAAHQDLHNPHHRRQASPATSTSIGLSSASSSLPVPSPPAGPTPSAPIASGSVISGLPSGSLASSGISILSNTPTTTFTFSLHSTNPTAVPLASIVSFEASLPTLPLASTAVPGSLPIFLPNAPPLPDASLLKPQDYPALDVPPPTDSPEVQQWIQDVMSSGIPIPNITQTLPGGCPANPQAATDQSRCWWTCGGCVRPEDIVNCPTAMDWGLTYDDGPSFYTENLLQFLDQHNLKSTFFVVGSRVISFPATLQTQYMGQHQIAVHTWSHPPLTTMTNEEIIAELGWSKKVIKDVLGVTPNVMRPPFGDIDDRVRAICMAMDLTPVIWTRISPVATYDTDDFNIHSGTTSVNQVLQNWENILGNATTSSNGFIVLEHDLFEESVQVATGYILPDALAHNPPFTIQPVVQCNNKPLSDAYVETNDNTTNPPPSGSIKSQQSPASSGGVDTYPMQFKMLSTAVVLTTIAMCSGFSAFRL